mmetsp:Transcript_21159/g.59134  ORF Transcript_21159/g.59134 Transcript_21159/m.59134 type:complete len:317 (+) Transcript_21159:108-1058(+)
MMRVCKAAPTNDSGVVVRAVARMCAPSVCSISDASSFMKRRSSIQVAISGRTRRQTIVIMMKMHCSDAIPNSCLPTPWKTIPWKHPIPTGKPNWTMIIEGSRTRRSVLRCKSVLNCTPKDTVYGPNCNIGEGTPASLLSLLPALDPPPPASDWCVVRSISEMARPWAAKASSTNPSMRGFKPPAKCDTNALEASRAEPGVTKSRYQSVCFTQAMSALLHVGCGLRHGAEVSKAPRARGQQDECIELLGDLPPGLVDDGDDKHTQPFASALKAVTQSAASAAESPEVGSSQNRTEGFATTPRATVTRLRPPPEMPLT